MSKKLFFSMALLFTLFQGVKASGAPLSNTVAEESDHTIVLTADEIKTAFNKDDLFLQHSDMTRRLKENPVTAAQIVDETIKGHCAYVRALFPEWEKPADFDKWIKTSWYQGLTSLVEDNPQVAGELLALLES